MLYIVTRWPCYDIDFLVLPIGHTDTYVFLDNAQLIVVNFEDDQHN